MAGERRGQARRTEVKQRGEMREETRRGGMWRRGMGRRGNYKEGEVGGVLGGCDQEKKSI